MKSDLEEDCEYLLAWQQQGGIKSHVDFREFTILRARFWNSRRLFD